MSEYSGTYKISNDQLICHIDNAEYTDVSPNDDEDVTLTFDITNNDTLKLVKVSDKYFKKSVGEKYKLDR